MTAATPAYNRPAISDRMFKFKFSLVRGTGSCTLTLDHSLGTALRRRASVNPDSSGSGVSGGREG